MFSEQKLNFLRKIENFASLNRILSIERGNFVL